LLKTINYLTFAQNGAVTITEYGDSEAAVVLLQMVGEQDMDGLASAAASPSVWFPGFIDYMKEHRPKSDAVYLSLGDREEKTRNPVMAAVGGRIREAHRLLEEQGMKTAQEWNPGNHFRNAEMRTARAFAWAMRQSTEVERRKDSGKPCGVI